MKRYLYLLFILSGIVSSCAKDEDVAITSINITDVSIVSQYTHSVIECTITSNGFISAVDIQYSEDSTFADYQICNMQKNQNRYSGDIASLKNGQTYYVRYNISNPFGSIIPNHIDTIRTYTYTAPKIQTMSVSDATTNSLLCRCMLSDWGCDTLPYVGICYATHPNVSTKDSTISITISSQDTAYSCSISNLNDNTTYYIRAFAQNSVGIAYGDELKITTIPILVPTITTDKTLNISYTSATCYGNIISDGGSEIIERGFCFSNNSSSPTISNPSIWCGKGTGSFSGKLPDLTVGTTYHVRAYATNGKGTAYGETITFSTLAYSVPAVLTSQITDITSTSAVCGGNIISTGGLSITECGICYSSILQNPTISSNKTVCGSETGLFSCCLSNLKAGTTYYVRAYATNSQGTAYGEQRVFTTGIQAPTITTSSIKDITCTSAISGGNVTATGGSPIIERGICYSTSPNPTISSNKIKVGNGTGTFSCNLTNLIAGTTYYIRAYATNSVGTAYGESITFMTMQYSVPSVVTLSVLDIASTTCVCNGEVISDGCSDVTERGICYSLSPNPTISNNSIPIGNGIGSYSYTLTGLTPNTIYYVCAYATNSQGIAYGEILSFTTESAIPIVNTVQVLDIAYTTATCSGNVRSSGGLMVYERGICYSKQANPTTMDLHVSNGNGEGYFTCNLSNLSAGTTYYARAYAINSKGTAYGEIISFTTNNYSEPSVTTSMEITKITSTSAICSGSIISDGGLAILEHGICYNTAPNPTIANSKLSQGTSMGSFSCNLTNLSIGTTYYIRAYAINGVGTAYGEQVVFTTKSYTFSISATSRIEFSPGNLQYNAYTDKWRFAEHQYDWIGDTNENISPTYNGWIDLFGWGTGNNPTNINTYLPNGDYSSFVDWGENQIGDDAPNRWRTLTYEEWDYLLNKRPNANDLYGTGRINDAVNGLILLPDEWVTPENLTFFYGMNGWYANTYTIEQWKTMEKAGAVFLPAAGSRIGSDVDYFSGGYYWTATESYDGNAYNVGFIDHYISPMYRSYRYFGYSVRLVRNL